MTDYTDAIARLLTYVYMRPCTAQEAAQVCESMEVLVATMYHTLSGDSTPINFLLAIDAALEKIRNSAA